MKLAGPLVWTPDWSREAAENELGNSLPDPHRDSASIDNIPMVSM